MFAVAVSFVILFQLVIAASESNTAYASGTVIAHSAPSGLPPVYRSADFVVTAGAYNIDLYNAGNNSWNQPVSYGYFEMSGSVTVSVTPQFSYSSFRIIPQSLGITGTKTGNTINFTLTEPANVTIVLDGNYQGKALHLFAESLETDIPGSSDPDVIYFGPGYHDLGGASSTPVMVGSNQTVYIAGGAVVRGRIRAEGASNVTIRGRGILLNDYASLNGYDDIALMLNYVTNATVRDIKVNRNHGSWTAAMYGSSSVNVSNFKTISPKFASTDGFNIVSSHDVVFDHVFIRSADDAAAVKGMSAVAPASSLPVYNITYQNSQLWSDANNAIEIGAETQAAYFDNILFQNIDVLYNFDDRNHPDVLPDRSAINIFALDGTYFSDITFDDIRVEKAKRLINVQMDENFYFGSITGDWSHPGEIAGITYKNIVSYSDGSNEIKLAGWDASHRIRDVTFENVIINGSPVANLNDPRFNVNPYVQDIKFVSSAGTVKTEYDAYSDFSTVQGDKRWSYRRWNSLLGVTNMNWNASSWRGVKMYDQIWTEPGKVVMHPDDKQVMLEWSAPQAGTVNVTGTVRKQNTAGGDGVFASIWSNGTMVWPTGGLWHNIGYNDAVGASHDIEVKVQAGDVLSFRVDQGGNNGYDATYWTPHIQYQTGNRFDSVLNFDYEQGNRSWYYRVWKAGVGKSDLQFNIDGSNHWRGPNAYDSLWKEGSTLFLHPDNNQIMLEWEAPKAGEVQVTGVVKKQDTGGGDGVNVSVWKNNAMVWPMGGVWQTIAYNDTTGYAHDFTVEVAPGDILSFRVDQRSTIDFDSTAWNPVISY